MADPVLSPWDAAALLPIISEAGGMFTDWEGRATVFEGGGVVATNAALGDEIRSHLAVPTGLSARIA
jgi:histidinol-phosphatase